MQPGVCDLSRLTTYKLPPLAKTPLHPWSTRRLFYQESDVTKLSTGENLCHRLPRETSIVFWFNRVAVSTGAPSSSRRGKRLSNQQLAGRRSTTSAPSCDRQIGFVSQQRGIMSGSKTRTTTRRIPLTSPPCRCVLVSLPHTCAACRRRTAGCSPVVARLRCWSGRATGRRPGSRGPPRSGS